MGTAFSQGNERQLTAELRSMGAQLGLPLDRLTLYAIRRGGATWDFQQHFLLARSMTLGRWGSEKTARLYIDQAMAQQAEASLTKKSKNALNAAARVSASLLDLSLEEAELQVERTRRET